MDRWTKELTQHVKSHPLRRLEHAKAATPGCLFKSLEYQRRSPTPRALQEVLGFSRALPYSPDPLQDARGTWWGAHGHPRVVTPQNP